MPIRSHMSSIMEQIVPEHPELFVLEFGKIAESDFVYTLASTNINQSAPNLVKMYVTIRSQKRLIMDSIGPELSDLFPLEFAEIAESDFVYTIASTNVDQLVPNMVTVYYMTVRSWMSLIMGQIELERKHFNCCPYIALICASLKLCHVMKGDASLSTIKYK